MTSRYLRRPRGCTHRQRGSAAPVRDVLALVAHDLRAPLAALRLSTELALDAAGDPAAQRHLLQTARRQVEQLERLTLDLLEAFADGRVIAAGQERVDLAALCRDLVAEFTLATGRRRVIALECGAGVVALGSAARLRVALRNLIANALKYSPEDAPVRVRAFVADGRALVVVQDRGAGIDPADLPRIFARTYRGEAARQAPGHGLGLYLAQQIVAAHGGEIAVESAPGAGSCFTVALPLADALSAPAARQQLCVPA
jgi:signal transduction histidine kinase